MASKIPPALELSLPATFGDAGTTSETARDDVLLLFDECGAGLRRYVWSFGLDSEATDDVLQDVFLSLFKHLCLGRPRTNLKGWLFQVAHNLALKQRQRRWRLLQRESAWDDTLADRLVDPGGDPEEMLRDAQRRDRLHAVLRVVSERDRQCFYLRAEGLAYRDIARTLGISLGSVAKSLARVITRLTNADMR